MAKHTNHKVKTPPTAGISTIRTLALAATGVAVGLFGVLLARRRPGNAEHTAPDLALDQPRPGSTGRAPEAFRPDPTAAVPASEREGLRPATGPVPTIVEPRGSMRSQIG
ncbi:MULTISPECIES: hypothetical protein [unclassified Sphingomonas]|uniref:hypothetical protein n=1 Tax=unclassified Sphingomonas TaxID=196159 RepID=UPI000A4326C6|nr:MULTISPECIES: hypothetical protein [unclassified Sphingomonas]